MLDIITKSNCNYHLERLRKERLRLARDWDRAVIANNIYDIEKLERALDINYEVIDKLSEFRKHNQCLVKGEVGYGPL